MNYSFLHCFLPWDSMDLHTRFSLCIVELLLIQDSYDFNITVRNMMPCLRKMYVCARARVCVFVLLAESQVNHKCQGNILQYFPQTTENNI